MRGYSTKAARLRQHILGKRTNSCGTLSDAIFPEPRSRVRLRSTALRNGTIFGLTICKNAKRPARDSRTAITPPRSPASSCATTHRALTRRVNPRALWNAAASGGRIKLKAKFVSPFSEVEVADKHFLE